MINRYGAEITFNHVEKLAVCAACGNRQGLDARPVYTFTVGLGNKAYST